MEGALSAKTNMLMDNYTYLTGNLLFISQKLLKVLMNYSVWR